MSLIVVLHTVPSTVEMLGRLLEKRLPEADIRHLLDTGMLPDLLAGGERADSVSRRFVLWLDMCREMGAAAVLTACSSLGDLANDHGADVGMCSRLGAPLFRIDAPMAELAVRRVSDGATVGVLATLPTTLGPTRRLLEKAAAQAGRVLSLQEQVIEGAGALLLKGDKAAYLELVRAQVRHMLSSCDLVVLAQASMAASLEGLAQAVRERVLASTETGVEAVASWVASTCREDGGGSVRMVDPQHAQKEGTER